MPEKVEYIQEAGQRFQNTESPPAAPTHAPPKLQGQAQDWTATRRIATTSSQQQYPRAPATREYVMD